jgi:hypothetical protein
VEEAMTDELPETGDFLFDLLFAVGATVTVGAMMIASHALSEALQKQEKKKELER